MNSRDPRSAFTLVELSIVLVIIGLIVGGIVGGQSLIHTAKLNKIITKIEEYRIAINNFDMQYDALPGDFSEATDYWPDCEAGGSGNCQGDGNGTWLDAYEAVRMWQHLSLAELVPQSYSGKWGSGGGADISYPSANFNNGVYFPRIYYYAPGNWMTLATGKSGSIQGEVMTPVDAHAIDKKTDDGDAGEGRMRFFNAHSVNSGCHIGATTDHVADLTSTTIACRVFFRMTK
jgi:prepilin-type N-terminal cleavage/methylation domain-containing protein